MRNKQRGAMFIMGALLLIPLMGFAVLALDVGRVFVVRNEMQNVADSAALAGANCLTRQSDPASATECLVDLAGALNWARAQARAEDQISENAADNLALSSVDAGHVIQVGYWNLLTQAPSGGAFNTAFAPLTVNDRPAVRVVVTKAAGVNNGPIGMLTQMMFNVGAPVPMSAEAVAVISAPGSVLPNSVIPQAINKCMFDLYWDSVTNSPKLADQPTLTYVAGQKTFTIPQVIGQPWVIRIGSAYHYGACDSGQWTSFNLDVNSQAAVGNLIANGNPTSLGIGDMTWIQPGTKAASYDDLDAKYPTGPGADVTVLVVNTADLTNHGQAPITAFAGFHISDIVKAPEKYIEGHFIPSVVAPGGVGIGPFFGAYTPPRLSH
jgi:Flp pilus assembly protein TadG